MGVACSAQSIVRRYTYQIICDGKAFNGNVDVYFSLALIMITFYDIDDAESLNQFLSSIQFHIFVRFSLTVDRI